MPKITEPFDTTTRLPEAWERSTGESARAYAAFCVYRDLDPAVRSIAEAARVQHEKTSGKGRGTLVSRTTHFEKFSAAHHWQTRAELHDQELQRIEYAARVERRQEMGRRHEDLADRMLTKALDVIEDLKIEEIGVAEAIRLCEVSVRLGRLVAGDTSGDDEVEDPDEGSEQDLVRELLGGDKEVARAGARFGAQVLRAQREREEA